MKGPLLTFAFTFAACTSTEVAPTPGAESFDGPLTGWRADTTGGTVPTATWITCGDAGAISRPNVLSLQATNHGPEECFNLFWTAGTGLVDGSIAVSMRADAGEVDQGGGPMWRVQDANNYYLCRLNPLESNFRVYVVHDGMRRQLASAMCEAKVGEWHRLEATFVGDRITCSVDGKVLLEAQDGTIGKGGGHGLWTKADARSSFDDCVVAAKK